MGDLMFREPDKYMQEMWDDFVDVTDRSPAFRSRVWAPAVDVRRKDKEYVLEADLPGMTQDDINVRVESDRLVLEGDKQEEHEEEEEGYLRKERYSRSFQRRFRLPTDVNQSKISAEFQKGVLTVKLPRTKKQQQEQGREIEVKVK